MRAGHGAAESKDGIGGTQVSPLDEAEMEEEQNVNQLRDNNDARRRAGRDADAEPSCRKRKKDKEARRSALQVASLNINGFGNMIRDHPDNKWGRVYRMMADNRIGVLMMQETHLTEERKASIHKMFAKKVKVFHSENREAPTQREGVAVVLNARYVKTAGATATEIVPGRALQVSVPCQGGDTKIVLCIYAPTSNGVAERKLFFEEVSKYYDDHPQCPKPHLMAGDFNNVEDSVDRLPIGDEPDRSIAALDELKIRLGLMLADGWRATYPNIRDYTFHRGSGKDATFSRLDRFYVSPEVFEGAREWAIREAGVKTDHSLILVQLTPKYAPLIGPGRPIFPVMLMSDKLLSKKIKARGLEAMNELTRWESDGRRSTELNPQRILHRFKRDAMKLARDREKEVVPKLLAEIRAREKALRVTKANRELSEELRLCEAEALTKQIRQLKLKRYKQQQQNARATHRLYGDRTTKYWSKLHRECAPRDIINAFEKEGCVGVAGEKIYENDSVKMAEMARAHHMNVQRDEFGARTATEREADIAAALDSLEARVTNEQAEGIGGAISYNECELALRGAKNGSAPGIDGIPFEFWKTLHARHIDDSRFPDRTDFDIVRLLQAAFEDMRTSGVDGKTSWAQGWIAPIYKEKGERTRVVNYRPITLLNTDYKLLSKTLAVRLANVAPSIIHRAQAGFVPGRKIHDHTQLARMMMYWAEENEEDGAIVALDQEKAYDKIAHDYLWRVLARFGIPETFIKLVQSLYKNAFTSVMINGILSKAYRVFRGVRQGDPLSCLLFDLAIEPLSAMIRKSDIRGFNIPRCKETLKAVLFADDTTVYLSDRDDFSTLQKVLDAWCSAAKARFNISKTEIIPIGSPAFRKEMAETYRGTGSWKNYPRGVHVAQDGEAIRILGAFFGNGVSQVETWSLVLTKIVAMRQPLMQVIARWKAGHASIQGKRHVVQMIVGGMTQFLTNVQRMPDEVLTRLNRIIRGYLWDDKSSPPVALEHVCLSVARGGLGMIDLAARNEAIDVMWLKAYLSFGEERPVWAYLVDDLYASLVTKACRPSLPELRINPFLQKWRPKARGLPAELQGMMNIARKYGLRLEGLAFSRKILNEMPMWDHIYADRLRLSRLSVPSKLLTCLQTSHGAMTVGDFMRLARTLREPDHRPKASCGCACCTAIRADSECTNPHACSQRAKDMLETLPGKWNPTSRLPEDYEKTVMDELKEEGLSEDLVPFDRRITTEGNLSQAFRIFTDGNPVSNEVVRMEMAEDGSAMTIATDGSCLHNGEERAQAGAGIFVEGREELHQALRLPSNIEQSNQTGEIVATLVATETADENTRVTQETDSQTTLYALTRWLRKHEDSGYILQKNAALTRVTIANLRKRKAHTIFQWVKGHNGHTRNEAADELAARGAAKTAGDHICLDIPPELELTGAKLQSITQKLAYHAIRTRKERQIKPRPRTAANLDRILSGIQEIFGSKLREEAIWISFRSRHVSRPAAQFMWMAVHDGYMIGTHWQRPKMAVEKQARATCAICGEIESMTHILFDCSATGQELIWLLLKKTWLDTGERWYDPCWGTALGAACAVFKSAQGARKTAIEQLWCILCTEALHLIWKMRCERVIQNEGEDFTAQEVTNRFYSTMDSRLTLDRRTSAKAKGKKALKPQDVERIWLPVIGKGLSLPPNWVVDDGVLVGIKRGK